MKTGRPDGIAKNKEKTSINTSIIFVLLFFYCLTQQTANYGNVGVVTATIWNRINKTLRWDQVRGKALHKPGKLEGQFFAKRFQIISIYYYRQFFGHQKKFFSV